MNIEPVNQRVMNMALKQRNQATFSSFFTDSKFANRPMNDLKFALRQLLKNPGFTAVAVLTPALGIRANTTIRACL